MKNEQRTFVMGDCHGGYKALLQVLERSKFDYEKDRLISLGDVADGWPDVAECFEELMKIKNFVMVRGNHDEWLLNYLRFEETPDIWIMQGGKNSFASYQKYPELKEKHKNFLMSTPYYFIDEQGNLYVHGGIIPGKLPEDVDPQDLMWDRSLWHMVQTQDEVFIPGFNHVYVGHTSIWRKSKIPLKSGNLWHMDTGGGFEGKLSLLDVDSEKFYQSDVVSTLYPKQNWT